MPRPPKFIAKSQAKIFICYRRSDTAGGAGRLAEHLEKKFGSENVFRDIDSISGGSDFDEVINNYLNECNVFLAVIGKRWTNGDGSENRLKDPEDFVRKEISIALKREIIIIPVFMQQAGFPPNKEIPDELLHLTKKQAEEIRESSWDYDVFRLIKIVKQKTPAGLSWPRILIYSMILAALVTTIILLIPAQKTNKTVSSFPQINTGDTPSQKPLLELAKLPEYNHLLRDNGIIPIDITLKNSSQLPAKNIEVKMIGIKEFRKGSFQFAKYELNKMNEGSKSMPGEGTSRYTFKYNFKDEDAINIDPHDTYFYLAISYTDESGKARLTSGSIYLLLASSNTIMEVNSNNVKFNGIKEFLRINEKWQ